MRRILGQGDRTRSSGVVLCFLLLGAVFFGSSAAPIASAELRASEATESSEAQRGTSPVTLLERYTRALRFPGQFSGQGLAAWKKHVPEVERVTIPCSSDGASQAALFYDSGTQGRRPLLVSLHSWSSGYSQHTNIPYALFAKKNDWIFLQPDFRGPNRTPESMASDLAVSDVVDAIRWVSERSSVDPDRIYLVGASGGGMKALVLAGRHPELFAGVVAWVPVWDLVDWYEYNEAQKRKYAREIRAACGGVPAPGSAAEAECRRRSPRTHLPRAREASVPILIAHGVRDTLVPPSHSLNAFNQVASEADRITDDEIRALDQSRRRPAQREGERDPSMRELFERAGSPLLFTRNSGNVTLLLFQGEHDMLYNPGLHWLAAQRRR